jgi:hypothetical protein
MLHCNMDFGPHAQQAPAPPLLAGVAFLFTVSNITPDASASLSPASYAFRELNTR